MQPLPPLRRSTLAGIALSCLLSPFSSAFAEPSAAPSPVTSPAAPVPAVVVSGTPTPTPAATPVSSASRPLEVERVEGSIIYFQGREGGVTPRPLNVGLTDVKFLSLLRSSQEQGSVPYVLIAGRACVDCLQDRGIYLVRVEGGKPVQFVYPGKIFEQKTRSLVIESRSFYGRCLAGYDDVYVVFQRERVDRRKHLQASVYLAEPGAEMVHERLLERRLPSLNHTLRQVKAKKCWEIEGRNRLMLSKPLDLNPRRGGGDDKDEDDEDEDENGKEREAEGEPAAARAVEEKR